YVRAELVTDLSYFSLLKPLSDVVIFHLLGDHLDAVGRTHSCNIRKPWCEECAKCAYVWISCLAYLPPEVVLPLFRSNLLDNPANEVWFRQMLGLEDYTPFECVGQADEARLAFELARCRGVTGRAMTIFEREVPPIDVDEIIARRCGVDPAHSAMPHKIAERVMPLLLNAGQRAHDRLLHQALTHRADHAMLAV
ncbi:MAG: hypothetical protein ACRD2Z_07650, partial [Thermoanaerobaculia bacterium]